MYTEYSRISAPMHLSSALISVLTFSMGPQTTRFIRIMFFLSLATKACRQKKYPPKRILKENSDYVLPILGDKSLPAKKISSEEDIERELLEHLKSMYAAFDRKDACYEYKLVGSTFLICGKLFPLMSQGAGLTDTRDARLKEILVYIQSAYSRSLSLDDIAGHVGLSRSECCRYFKSQTGQTLFEYLIQYRINKSLDILANTDTPVAQIAQAVGFSSQSYYTDRFKGIIGMTPTEYRKRFL